MHARCVDRLAMPGNIGTGIACLVVTVLMAFVAPYFAAKKIAHKKYFADTFLMRNLTGDVIPAHGAGAMQANQVMLAQPQAYAMQQQQQLYQQQQQQFIQGGGAVAVATPMTGNNKASAVFPSSGGAPMAAQAMPVVRAYVRACVTTLFCVCGLFVTYGAHVTIW